MFLNQQNKFTAANNIVNWAFCSELEILLQNVVEVFPMQRILPVIFFPHHLLPLNERIEGTAPSVFLPSYISGLVQQIFIIQDT